MALVLILLSVLITTVVFKYILDKQHLESYVKHLYIHPPVYPVLGNLLWAFGLNPTEVFRRVTEIFRTTETPFKSYLGTKLVVSIDRPEDIQAAVKSQYCIDKPYFSTFLPIKSSIIIVDSSIWRPIRKAMNPSFNLKIMQSYLPIINEKTGILMEILNNEVGKQQFDILPFLNACALDMVSASSMGYNFDVQRSKNREFLHSFEALFGILIKRLTIPWAHFDFIYRWTELYRQQQKLSGTMRRITCRIYDQKKKEYIAQNKHNLEAEKNKDDSYKKPQNLIDNLIGSVLDGKLDDLTAIDQIETVLIAGNDTSSLEVAYTVLLLAMHPEIQERLFDELRSVYETQDEPSTCEHFQQLPYMEQALKEGMRLFPVLPILMRKTTADVKLFNCTVPKNSIINISVYNMHRRPDIWGKSADEFNPDHFLPENVAKRHPFSFIPFSAGPRNCIGYQYGWLSMKTMLSALVRNYKFTTKLKMSELEVFPAVTMKLNNRHLVAIERRVWSEK